MPFADNTIGGRVIEWGDLPVKLVITDTAEPGDLVGYDGTNWVRADANSTLAVLAEYIAGQRAASGDTIVCYRRAFISGWTTAGVKGDLLFLSDTIGEYTITPGAASQLVGTMVSTTEALIDLSVNSVRLTRKPVVAKTANYTLVAADCGKIFTNKGATGAVTFTLPAVTLTGFHARFVTAVLAQDVTIASAAAGEMILFNDIAANSIAFSTASERAGNGVEVVSDGALWLVFVSLGAETATPTIAT